MPLAFDSLSHGTVAFGFFNIESDMLLLDHFFFFATEFCTWVGQAAEEGGQRSHEREWQVYRIERPENAGDLTAAIYGIYYQGFIGEVYRRYPFPKRPEEFKQKAEGHGTQRIIKGLIEKYADRIQIPFVVDEHGREAAIGPYRFSKGQFHSLLIYVWQGGYPRWREEVRPQEVLAMRKKIEGSAHPIFEGMRFDGP